MKLFQRTLLSFAGAIFLQAALAGAALATIFGSMQTEDAARELKTEAESAYGAFNAWKLAFWKDINELAENGRLLHLVESARLSPSDVYAVEEALRQGLAGSGAESVFVEDGFSGRGRFLYRDPHDRGAPDGSRLSVARAHPYIEIVSTPEGLWFVGVVRIAPAARRPLDVFLLKRIDENLVSQLSYDPMVAVVVSDGIRNILGRYPGASGDGRHPLENAGDFIGRIAGMRPENSYVLFPRRDGPAGSYAAVLQQSGSVSTPGGEATLTVSTVLSYELYEVRASRINGAVLAVSLIVAAFTIAAALALTRSIVDPVRRLSAAMRCVEEGDYGAAVQGRAGGELGELLTGFNGMARKLEADKSELDAYMSQRLAAEARMIQADRLASMSMLSAGVAHEINNPLSSILSNVQNLISEAPEGESVEALRIVERETKRIARIVRQLLDFSAPRYPGASSSEPFPRCSPAAVIDDLVILVGYPFRAEGRIRIVQDVAADCPDAAIAEDELKQVLLNLMKNALESIGERGTIVVGASAAPEGVELSVSDDGPGIPEEALGKIFDPFFTTKASRAEGAVGIGLGLSVVYGIVTTRGGRISAENDPKGSGGAVLRVLLPAAEDRKEE
ncbi:MAG: sensor histidine kinase [Rectinemataceae bacterium]